MKHFFNFTIFAIILMMMIGCATSNEYIVTGKDTTGRCPDGEWAYLCLQKENPGDFHYIDSVQIENNSFRFEGEIETPTIAHIMTRAYNDSLRLAKPAVVHSFILEKGHIQTAVEDDIHCPSGTPLNDKISAFFNGLISLLQNAEQQNLSEEETLRQGFEYVRNTVQDNCSNEFGVFVVDNISGEFSPKEDLELYALLPDKQEYFAQQIADAKKASQFEIGAVYTDVSEPSKQGEQISLKSIVEKQGYKYVLLEFWASWCGPCMHEMPNLKATYKKYHNKGFEVYASSLDSNREDWIDAMDKMGMNWINVSGLKVAESPAPKQYAITAIPSNFLIDCSTGKIIAKNLRGDNLENKLNELLK